MLGETKVVLGSQSPQRRNLLEQIVPLSQIVVCPPSNAKELGFSGMTTRAEILQRLLLIARQKNEDVFEQRKQQAGSEFILTADTIVLVGEQPEHRVLGKPQGENWQADVKRWFWEDYSDKRHEVITSVCLRCPPGELIQYFVSTEVTFHPVDPELLEWYLDSGEPLGKAGGYGIQSAGSLFVRSISGSLSNVIGLPLERVWQSLHIESC